MSDDVDIRDLPSSFTASDVRYLPKPNRVESILTSALPPIHLCTTAHAFAFLDDGSMVMSYVRDRHRFDVPGGHIEENETPEGAVFREVLEETGCHIADLKLVGHLRMIALGSKPIDYHYPFPLSYQLFYAARISKVDPFEDTSECGAPQFFTPADVYKGKLPSNLQPFWNAARHLAFL